MISQVSIWDENKISPEKNTCIKTNEWHIDRKGASYKSLYSGRTTFLSMALVGALLAGIGLAVVLTLYLQTPSNQTSSLASTTLSISSTSTTSTTSSTATTATTATTSTTSTTTTTARKMSTVIHALHQATVDPVTLVPLRAMVVSSLASAIRNRGQPSTHQ
ncbi:unnamed protein product [Rotaria socialis]|uniref:Uncharacterized protein n=2 Tax=Rotaria socialis TaxID=392032 RepID=A0A820VR05_9BILA|nr:unnamed protein product [Rotaria socialis]